MKKIIVAGGCFWGVEAFFERKSGVVSTSVVYVNGNTVNPTYEQVCSHRTGFAEGCYIEYDEAKTTLGELLSEFWKIIDPTVKDRQGHDLGNQYRTGIYYFDKEDLVVINKSKADQQINYVDPIVTEVEKVKNYYTAEEYHQKYLDKNPGGYCHIPRELLED